MSTSTTVLPSVSMNYLHHAARGLTSIRADSADDDVLLRVLTLTRGWLKDAANADYLVLPQDQLTRVLLGVAEDRIRELPGSHARKASTCRAVAIVLTAAFARPPRTGRRRNAE